MHTHNINVKTAARKTPERWGETLRHIINSAHYNVACAQEVHAHYGDKFTSADGCYYFIRGALAAMRNAVTSRTNKVSK